MDRESELRNIDSSPLLPEEEEVEEEEESGGIEEVKDNEEPVALKDVLRLVETSEKAINHMNEHQFSTVWGPCSSNTYGNENHQMLVIL